MKRLFALSLSLLAAEPALAQTGPLSAQDAAELRRQIEALRTRLGDLERRLDQSTAPAASSPPAQASAPSAGETPALAAAPPRDTRPTLSWEGSPQAVSGDRSFKAKGRIQLDAGYVAPPDGLDDPGLGFVNEFRRIRLGAEGDLGGGFGYKLELELSGNEVDLVDTFITYETDDWLLSVGNQNQFQSLDELIGDTTGAFMERAAFTDAFGFERRLGLAAQYKTGPLLLQGGVFTDDAGALADSSDGPDGGDENNSVGLDARAVFAPRIGDTQLHLGASAHWRKLNRLEEAPVRYRQRPYLHATNSRFLATPGLGVEAERHWGFELAGAHGPWWFAGETHWLNADRLLAPSPTFFGGYAEIGYFVSKGDSRPYRSGIFGRTKPKRPVGEGGLGALQVSFRYDHLDLNDAGVLGGKQNGYIGALIWTPIDWVRLNLNYAHLDYTGAALPLSDGDRDYGVDVLGTRIELDF